MVVGFLGVWVLGVWVLGMMSISCTGVKILMSVHTHSPVQERTSRTLHSCWEGCNRSIQVSTVLDLLRVLDRVSAAGSQDFKKHWS